MAVDRRRGSAGRRGLRGHLGGSGRLASHAGALHERAPLDALVPRGRAEVRGLGARPVDLDEGRLVCAFHNTNTWPTWPKPNKCDTWGSKDHRWDD